MPAILGNQNARKAACHDNPSSGFRDWLLQGVTVPVRMRNTNDAWRYKIDGVISNVRIISIVVETSSCSDFAPSRRRLMYPNAFGVRNMIKNTNSDDIISKGS